ncbi:MAG: DegT/DnrJ/EryC1/StrS family aminotransferase [Proteobacteria bacterium]|nr:DegT/DnrJ/EryC1/StrS family aminotransferase [Pseudomonadota bacterium]
MLDLKAEYLYMKADIDAAIVRCLGHQQWIFGPEVKEFEDKVAEYFGVKHCIGISSGTDALVLALRALAIKTKGQEYFDHSDLIITTPFTFTATGDAILHAGATPLFIDIDPATYNLDPSKIRDAVRSQESEVKGLKNTPYSLPLTPNRYDLSLLTPHPLPSSVVGILPVHLYGQPCNMDEIVSIASEHNLFVVEDCAQAFGGDWQKAPQWNKEKKGIPQGKDGERRKVGNIGDVGAFSFFPSKNLGGFGDAGMVSTNDDEINDLVRMLIKHGGKDKYNVDHIGYNARMDTLQAAILLAKLPYIDEFNTRRLKIAQLYIDGLKDIPGVILPATSYQPPTTESLPLAEFDSPLAGFGHVYHQYTIRVKNGKRDALQRHLKDAGIESMVYYPVPLHRMKVFEGMCIYGELSEAERAANEVLSLPVEPLQSQEIIFRIVEAIKKFST